MKKIPGVALIIEQDRQYGRDILSGITDYSRHFGPWSFYTDIPFFLNPGSSDCLEPLLDSGMIDGIITRETRLTEKIINSGIPFILCPYSEQYYNYPAPLLIGDDCESGTIAAEHFIELGIRNFAYCGFNSFPWSRNRFQCFKKRLGRSGFNPVLYPGTASGTSPEWPDEKEYMAQWLKSLEKPVGLMTCTDERSLHVAEACKTAGLRIPEDVVILGVDNDSLLCELSAPPLSSIALDCAKAGYEAAALLARMMNGEETAPCRITAPVAGIHVRESSRVIAVEDDEVYRAMIFIRRNSNRIIGVDDVVEATGLSRRALEIRFNEALNSTIYENISRSRAELIAQILRETDYPISRIALDLGYSGVDHIARFFSREMGVTPLNYRKAGSKQEE